MKKFKTLLAGACTLALSATLLFGCSNANEGADNQTATPADENNASEPTTLTVGFDAGYPPYGYVADDGTYTGFDLELAQAVADKNGWELVTEPIDWDAKDALIQSGSIDCIWNGFTMEGREDDYTFSDPYMLNEQVIVVRNDSGIDSTADLADKTVITQADSAALDVLNGDQAELKDTFKELSTMPDSSCIKALL